LERGAACGRSGRGRRHRRADLRGRTSGNSGRFGRVRPRTFASTFRSSVVFAGGEHMTGDRIRSFCRSTPQSQRPSPNGTQNAAPDDPRGRSPTRSCHSVRAHPPPESIRSSQPSGRAERGSVRRDGVDGAGACRPVGAWRAAYGFLRPFGSSLAASVSRFSDVRGFRRSFPALLRSA